MLAATINIIVTKEIYRKGSGSNSPAEISREESKSLDEKGTVYHFFVAFKFTSLCVLLNEKKINK